MEPLYLLHAKDISHNLEPLINELKSSFYFPFVTLVAFEYKVNSFNPEVEIPSFIFFIQVYKTIFPDIDESKTDAWFERISKEEFKQKINDFCMHSGANTTVLEDDAATTTRRSNFFCNHIDNFLQTLQPTIFELQTIGRGSYFHPSGGWGCALFLFNHALGKGMIIYTNPIF